MRQRKFTTVLMAVIFTICGALVTQEVMAGLTDNCTVYKMTRTCSSVNSCQTFLEKPRDNSGNYITTTVSISGVEFPKVFDTWSIEAESYCGPVCEPNSPGCNYPCTVFRYQVSGPVFQHHFSTIPYCSEFPLDVIPLSYSTQLSNACTGSISFGDPFWAPPTCGTQVMRFSNKTSPFVALKGKNVGMGVNSLGFVDNSGPGNVYVCATTGSGNPPDIISKDLANASIVVGGILGPGCQGTVAQGPTIFQPVITSECLTDVAIKDPISGGIRKGNVRVFIEGGQFTKVQECSDKNCVNACVDKPVVRISADLYDITDPNTTILLGNFNAMEGGGTMEEKNGYIVTGDGVDPTCLLRSGSGICLQWKYP